MRIISVLLLLSVTSSSFAAVPAATKKVADSQYEAGARLARESMLAIWSARFDELLASVPNAKSLEKRWEASDPHWQAARSAMLDRMAKVMNASSGTAEARERFDASFGRMLKEEQAKKLLPDLATLKSKEYEAYAASIYSGVEYLTSHPDASPAGKEISSHINAVLASLKLDRTAAEAPAVTALARRDEGSAFQSARDGAVRSLATFYDGQTQLYFNDQIETFKQDVLAGVTACGKGHKK